MPNTCPDCGASMELEEREVRLRTGVCPSCTKEFAFVEGTAVSSKLGAPPMGQTEEGEAEEEAGGAVEGGPECAECGTPLLFREGHHGSLEVVCPECETTAVFVPKTETPSRAREGPSRFDEQGPRGRPCRRCGAPLRFSTGEDGLLVGECESCGNRFTLPPRPDRGGKGRRYGGPPRPGGREFPRGRGGRSSYPGRRRDRGDRRYDDEDRPRRRRSPRDE